MTIVKDNIKQHDGLMLLGVKIVEEDNQYLKDPRDPDSGVVYRIVGDKNGLELDSTGETRDEAIEALMETTQEVIKQMGSNRDIHFGGEPGANAFGAPPLPE